MAYIINTTKQKVSEVTYAPSGGNVQYRLYLQLISQDSTNMVIYAQVTNQGHNNGYYSGYAQTTSCTINGQTITGANWTPGTWSSTETTRCSGNITVPRNTTITWSFTSKGANPSEAGTYATASGTAYAPNDCWVNINGTWKRGYMMINVNGTWKWASSVYDNINGAWKERTQDAST